MTPDKGIFEPKEGFAGGSPFASNEAAPPSSPFATPAPERSPFAVTAAVPRFSLPGKTAAAEPKAPAGGETGATAPFASPFQQAAAAPSSTPPPPPFAKMEAKPPASATPVAAAAAEAVPEPTVAPAATPAAEPVASAAAPAPTEETDFESDSRSIRQLELRAIFGVDRELTEGEILQRSRALPGIRQFAKVPESDAGAVDGIRRVMGGIGFGPNVKLYCGNAPVEFIREGRILLAVQTDGGFAPGVRETLMIVARELGKM